MATRRSPEKISNRPEVTKLDKSNKENIGVNQGSPSTDRKRVKTEFYHYTKVDSDSTTNGFSLALVKYDPNIANMESTEKRRSRYQRLVTGELSKIHSNQENAGALQTRKGKAAKRDIGKLTRLLDAPLDVFCEVASYLQPSDILHLSRTTKGLRVLLMSKQSRLVWKTARDNVKLPECPEDLSEPQYAQLLFGRECDACGAPKVQKACFELKIRLCNGCASINIVRGTELSKSFGEQYCTDINMYNLVPCDRNTKKFHYSIRLLRSFLKPDFDDAALKYISLLADTERCKIFLDEREKFVQNAYDFSASIDDWIVNCRKEKRLEGEMNKSSRKEEIFKNLRELGYSDEDFKSLNNMYDKHDYEWSRCINQKRPLTAQIWKTICPKMEEIIKMRRAEKYAYELAKRYKSRRLEIAKLYLKHLEDVEEQIPTNDTLSPGLADVLSCPAAIALIQQNEGQQPITENSWKPLRDALPQLYIEIKNQMINKHFELLKNARLKINVDTDDGPADEKEEVKIQKREDLLGLASSVFCVKLGRKLAYYPNALRPRTKREMEKDMARVVEDPQKYLWITRVGFNCSSLVVKTASELLAALGVPLSTTAAEMAAVGAKFVCKRCDRSVREKFNWIGIVEHFQHEQLWYINAKKRLKTLKERKPETTIKVFVDHTFGGRKAPIMRLTATNENLYRPKSPPPHLTLCLLCSELGVNYDPNDDGLMLPIEMKAHLKYKHGITEPEDRTHFRYDVPDSFYDSDNWDELHDESLHELADAGALLARSCANFIRRMSRNS